MAPNNEATTVAFVPPYILTWRTFVTSLEKMADDETLPSVIDRSYLSSMPGKGLPRVWLTPDV